MHESIFILKKCKKGVKFKGTKLSLSIHHQPFHTFLQLPSYCQSFFSPSSDDYGFCMYTRRLCMQVNKCLLYNTTTDDDDEDDNMHNSRTIFLQHHISGKIQLQYSTYNNSKRHQKFIVCTFIVKAMQGKASNEIPLCMCQARDENMIFISS